jgi:AcrR family transcriptional regulator
MAIVGIELSINEKLFQRNPQHTELGRNILKHSVLMIDELGFECFNFRKLAECIGSTEASVYRYFENKHLLLVYLVNWHWEWMKFRIEMKVGHFKDPMEKLKVAISCIAATAQKSAKVAFIDEDALHRIVVSEGTKAYHHKKVDLQNEDGYFLSYKSLSEKIAGIIEENNPDFPYPRALASNLLEMANNHTYFAEHLPRLTEVNAEGDVLQQVEELLLFFVERMVFLGKEVNIAGN